MQEKARRGIRFRKKDAKFSLSASAIEFFSFFVCGKAQNTNGKTTNNKNLEKVGYKMNIEKSITSILKKKSTSNCWLKKMHNLRAVS